MHRFWDSEGRGCCLLHRPKDLPDKKRELHLNYHQKQIENYELRKTKKFTEIFYEAFLIFKKYLLKKAFTTSFSLQNKIDLFIRKP
jgi:hypothetical protein